MGGWTLVACAVAGQGILSICGNWILSSNSED